MATLSLWDTIQNLTFKQRVLLFGALAVTGVLVLSTGISTSMPKMSLLYSGLDEMAAAELVQKVEEAGVAYKLEKDSIYVNADERDKLRLTLAQEGLPRRGQSGYELLDKMSGFGTTSEMFEATYWRAKEGELARTIMTMDGVEDVRVHIAPELKKTFSKDESQASASVMVKMKSGDSLSVKNAKSIRYMVALAVQRMKAEQVTVIDGSTGNIIGGDSSNEDVAEMQRRLDMENKMRTNLERLLSAHLGDKKVKVQVAMELDQEREIITERSVDPETRIAISTENSEMKEQNSEKEGDNVSVANNIPNANSQAGSGTNNNSNKIENKERVNYDVSEIRRERHKEAGSVKRISVAVMVDGQMVAGTDGAEAWQPMSADQMKTIQELVESASGFNASRGDVVTVRSLQFLENEMGTGQPEGVMVFIRENMDLIIQSFALMVAVLGLIFGIIRPILKGGIENHYQSEMDMMRSDYESRMKSFELPPVEEEEVISSTQIAIAQAEDAVRRHPEEALGVIRQWLHEVPVPAVSESDLEPNFGESSSSRKKEMAA